MLVNFPSFFFLETSEKTKEQINIKQGTTALAREKMNSFSENLARPDIH